MATIHTVTTPLSDEVVRTLKAGERVLISGTIYVARDAAHKRMVDALAAGRDLPFDPAGQVIFYAGPTPPRPGDTIGVVGPTTSGRMDAYAVPLLHKGLKGMIGKGQRSAEVKDAIRDHTAVYFVATGGVAALLKERIEHAEVIAYADLGPEAVQKLTVKEFPVIVANDATGGDVFTRG